MAKQMTISAVQELEPVTRTNILVVDDRPDGLLAMEAVLSSNQFNLFKAGSGQEALRYALFNDFAVILLDVQMPELDGFQTARLLRENFRSKDTPIIFVTAINKELRHINQGYESGAVDYIFKPFDPFVLKSKVNIFVDLFEKKQQIKHQAALLRQAEALEKERQITELKQESLRSYTHLADAAPNCILKVSPEGKVTYFNQRWLEYTGFGAHIDWKALVYPGDLKKFRSLWLKMRQSTEVCETEIRLRRVRDGVFRWHLVRAVPDVQNGESLSWIASCTDIDTIKNTEESFKTLSQELNRSNKELEEYAYVASHDLKEPLHVVSSFVHLLEKRLQPKLDERELQYLNFIKESVAQAQRLIKDLLEYSCVGKRRSFEKVDLGVALAEVLNNLRTIIEGAGAFVHCDPMPKVMGNYSEMLQIFQNLIANAVKYRSIRPLEIHINCRPYENMWLISVKDNGIGIDPQFKDRIFEMFQRLHGKGEYSGTGIGLAICKKIIESHGGKIWTDSTLGEGATFYFTIKQDI